MSLINSASAATGLPRSAVEKISRNAPRRYKVYSVPKRSGDGRRILAQPAKELKLIQKWLVKKVLYELPVHDAAMAYVRNRSIKTNAEAHVSNNFLLKLDFKSFFPSIKPADFVNHLNSYTNQEFTEADIWFMTQILFWRGNKKKSNPQLCIGGPSSPFVSNTVMYDFDCKVSEECSKRNVVYTRYADDLTFSTKDENVLNDILAFVESDCRAREHPKLRLNRGKTVWSSKKHLRRVTGLVLSSQGNVSLGRDRKRIIRSIIHKFSLGKLDSEQSASLKGTIAFAMDVDPQFVTAMREKYGDEVIDDIMS